MIHYVAYYSTKESGRVKNYAGEDKIDYICRVLNDLGEEVVILHFLKEISFYMQLMYYGDIYSYFSMYYFVLSEMKQFLFTILWDIVESGRF